MRLRTLLALCVVLSAPVALAQVKASGAIKCAKADPQHKADISDNHSLVLEQSKCSVDKEKPFEINGVKSGNGVSTDVSDVQGTKSRFHGYYVDTMESGDKAEYRFQGTGTIKDGALQSAEDSWTLVSGTGKLKGAQGKGTCKGSGAADGSISWDCQGEYTLVSK